MAEFSLHLRLDAEQADPADGEELLAPYVESHDSVEYGSDRMAAPDNAGVVIPETSSLEVDDIEAFADIYDDLRQRPEVHDLSLWGPSSERFPIPVQHYALQQIQQPDLYEFHAIDEQVTLVIAESELEAEQVQREVPAAAIGYSQSPF
jgi:hypothetical protein